jgi:hypothetical protein
MNCMDRVADDWLRMAWSKQDEEKKFREEPVAYFPWYDMDRMEDDASNNSIVANVSLAAVRYLQSRCLATI